MEIKNVSLSFASPPLPFRKPIEKIVLHHLAHPTWDIFDTHKNHIEENGWIGIGYNYFVDLAGNIYKGRGRNIGAHAGTQWNSKTLGIVFQGNFEQQEMPDKQLAAGIWLVRKLLADENLGVGDVVGHRDVAATLCPGKNFRMRELKEGLLKEMLKVKIFGKDIELENYIVQNNTNYIAIREIFEKIGCRVDWDNATQTVKITLA